MNGKSELNELLDKIKLKQADLQNEETRLDKLLQQIESERKNVLLKLRETKQENSFFLQMRNSIMSESYPNILLQWELYVNRYIQDFRKVTPEARKPENSKYPWMEVIKQYSKDKVFESNLFFADEFEKALVKYDIAGDNNSRHPRYSFANNFMILHADLRAALKDINWIERGRMGVRRLPKNMPNNSDMNVYPSVEMLPYFTMLEIRDGPHLVIRKDVNHIAKVVYAEWERLFRRPDPEEGFLRSLLVAYNAVVKTREGDGFKDGQNVSLREVINRMAKNIRTFSKDQFNVDLSKVVARDEAVVDNHRLELTRGRNGMILYNQDQNGDYTEIKFVKEGI